MFNFGLAEAVAATTPAPTLIGAGRGRDALTRATAVAGRAFARIAHAKAAKAAKDGKGVGELDLGFWILYF